MSKAINSGSVKAPLEANTRRRIEERLASLGYVMDEQCADCNIYRERAKYEFQDEKLQGRNPDFLIYQTGTSRILAVIEAKRPSATLEKAIDQAIDYYAKPLDIPIVFVYNSNSFQACTVDRTPIKIDNIEINDFVDEGTLLKLIENNYNIESIPEGISFSRSDLLKKFKEANNLLRKAGLRDGYERFSVFSDLIFLKLKNDFDDIGQTGSSNIPLDKLCNWKKLIDKIPVVANYNNEDLEVKSYLEDTIKKKLRQSYGDVFESSLNIKDESILIDLIKLIDTIPFKNVDSDVKGDAFEFFLKNVTNGNKDLGEYYTPRHIVKMIVKLLNPVYGEKCYDPCCGTGGFLLECFRYLRSHTNTEIYSNDSDAVSKEKKEKKRIIREESIYGRELTSTARIAKMNMILFGDGHTNIKQMDSLSERVEEQFDIVLSNIPYSQKVENGHLYAFPTNNGDSLFMQHIWDAVKPGGRIAVVVPDTFLYSDEKEIRFIRQKIVDHSSRLVIISLPRGVFNPYTPTKTSVVVAYKKKGEEKMEEASMYVIRNDGFELGARRRPLAGKSDCNKFLMEYNEDKELRSFAEPTSVDVPLKSIVNNFYNLFPFEYMEHLPEGVNKQDLIPIGDYIRERKEPFKFLPKKAEQECIILSVTKNGIYVGDVLTAQEMSELSQKYKRVYPGDFTYNPHRINVGSIGVVPKLGDFMYVSNIYPVFFIEQQESMPNYYLQRTLKSDEYKVIINDYCLGGARADMKIECLKKIKVAKPTETEKARLKDLSAKLDKAYQRYLDLYREIMEA